MAETIDSADLLDYVRENLTSEKRSIVEAACKTDKALADELAYYKGLNSALKDEREAVDEMPMDELKWAKLSRAIDDENLSLTPKKSANDNGRIWRFAACALAVALMGQTAFMNVNKNNTEDNNVYVTASKSAEAFSLQVTFLPTATEGNIRTLLLDVEAEIISGPSSLGVYALAFKTEEGQEAGLSVLSEHFNIVETVAKN